MGSNTCSRARLVIYYTCFGNNTEYWIWMNRVSLLLSDRKQRRIISPAYEFLDNLWVLFHESCNSTRQWEFQTCQTDQAKSMNFNGMITWNLTNHWCDSASNGSSRDLVIQWEKVAINKSTNNRWPYFCSIRRSYFLLLLNRNCVAVLLSREIFPLYSTMP